MAEAARVHERVRIANELHDTLSQLAFSVGLKLDWCLHRMTASAPLRPKLEDIRRDTGLMMAQIRQLIGHLSPEGLAETTFAKRLERLVKDFRELTGIATELDLRGDPSGLSAAACDLLQKTLQEALVNIAKHARARRAAVCIEVGGDQASIRVADDGVGLPAGVAEAARAWHGHLGLRQMRERIEAAVVAGGRHATGPHEAWIAADPFKGGFRALITGPQGFERTVLFAIDDDPAVITKQDGERLRGHVFCKKPRGRRRRGGSHSKLRSQYCGLRGSWNRPFCSSSERNATTLRSGGRISWCKPRHTFTSEARPAAAPV